VSTPARLGLFAAALALVFGTAFGAGSAVGPPDDKPSAPTSTIVDHGHP